MTESTSNNPSSWSNEELFQKATESLTHGEYSVAIDYFESLADRGFIHPTASFNRGMAYVTRIQNHAEKPGDLGRAAASFEETLYLKTNDRESEQLLDILHAEVVKRRARNGKDSLVARPTMDRAITELATEQTWATAAIAMSIVLTVALFLRSRADSSKALRLASNVTISLSLIGILILTPLTIFSHHLSETTRIGVTIASEITMTDNQGRILAGQVVPETSRVEVQERLGNLIRIRWGAVEGYVPIGSVRILQKP